MDSSSGRTSPRPSGDRRRPSRPRPQHRRVENRTTVLARSGRRRCRIRLGRPLLVGHSTGGYAVTAATAAGIVEPSGICIVDGLVLDDRQTASRTLAQFRTSEAADDLRQTFGYGRCFNDTQRDAWIEDQAANAATDWLNAGSAPELVRAVCARGFLQDSDPVFSRRPTPKEIAATTTAPTDAPIFPSIDVYERITCPMTIVLADRGFYASRRKLVTTIVQAAPQRHLVDIASGHNVVLTHPQHWRLR